MKTILSYLLLSFLFLVKGYGAVSTSTDDVFKYDVSFTASNFYSSIDKHEEATVFSDYVADDDEENDDDQTQDGRKTNVSFFNIPADHSFTFDSPVTLNRFSYTKHFAYTSTRKHIFQRVIRI